MHKVNVFITVDTEHSIGGAFNNPDLKPVGNDKRIYCRTPGGDFGIPMIMSIAEKYGHKISFFLEVLNKHYFEEAESQVVCEYILNREHDVQLHLHPNYLNFKTRVPSALEFKDNMHVYSLDEQVELIADGKKTLMRYGAPPPIAFRAGNFGADVNTLSALGSCGFLVDSSYNKAFANNPCKLCETDINDSKRFGKIWEFPVTNFYEKFGKFSRYRPLDLNGVSFRQMKSVLNQAAQKGVRCVTIVLHSFSFIKALDVQHTKIQIRKIVINRFKKLCRFLSENAGQFQVRTFNTIKKKELSAIENGTAYFMPEINPMLTIERHLEQLVDRIPGFRSMQSS